MAKANKLADELASSMAAADRLSADAELYGLRSEVASLRGKYKLALAQIDAERQRADSIAALARLPAKAIKIRKPSRSKGDATVIVGLSDWHCEELVRSETVNELNAFDLAVCERRITELAERFVALLEHQRQLVRIDRVVVWLGGDFLTGHIHEDCVELAQLAPLAATRWAGQRLRGFIDLVASMAKEVVVVTNSGNHGRVGDPRVGTELDHSFEQNLYLTMAGSETNSHVRWQVGESYLNNLDLDGFRVRFHHGHAVKYGGGVGGITIPMNKAVTAWDRLQTADLTVCGHYHQWSWLRASKFVTNGSLIGHNAYAIRIKAAYEPPCQSFIVVDHTRREVTDAKPIFCDRDLQERAAG